MGFGSYPAGIRNLNPSVFRQELAEQMSSFVSGRSSDPPPPPMSYYGPPCHQFPRGQFRIQHVPVDHASEPDGPPEDAQCYWDTRYQTAWDDITDCRSDVLAHRELSLRPEVLHSSVDTFDVRTPPDADLFISYLSGGIGGLHICSSQPIPCSLPGG